MYTASVCRSYCTNVYVNVYYPSPKSVVVTVQADMLMYTAPPLSLSKLLYK